MTPSPPIRSSCSDGPGAVIDACLRAVARGSTVTLPCDGFRDWRALCRIAADEGVGAPVYRALEASPALPPATRDRLRREYESALVFKDACLLRLQELREAVDRRIPIVLTQGIALLEHLYVEPLGRAMTDVDLLLPEGGGTQVTEALRALGYRPLLSYRQVWVREGFMIDLHEDLWGTQRTRARERLTKGVAVRWRPSEMAPGYGIVTREIAAMHAAYHGVKHGFARRVWALDTLLFRVQGAYGSTHPARRPGYVAAAIDYLALEGLLDSHEHEMGKRPGVRARLCVAVLRSSGLPGKGELALALSAPFWTDTVAYLWTSLFPRSAMLEQMYGGGGVIVLHLKRLWMIALRVMGIRR